MASSFRRLSIEGGLCYELTEKPGSQCNTVDLFNIAKTHFCPDLPQVTVSRSKKNVIRGLHCSPYRKIVCCPTGRAFDVCVDLRPNSPTFLKYDFVWLNKSTQIVIPAYCAHGFFAAEDDTSIIYLQEGCFNPALDFSVRFDDPTIGVKWPKPIDSDDYIISPKDRNNPLINDELTQAIGRRIENTSEVMEKGTLADFAIVCDGGYNELIQSTIEVVQNNERRVFCCSMNGEKRESLQEELYALKPKYCVLYFASGKSENMLENITNILNVVGACNSNQLRLTIIFDEKDFQGKEKIINLIKDSDVKIFDNPNQEQVEQHIKGFF